MERKTIYTILISLGVIFLLLGGYSLITGTPLLSSFGGSSDLNILSISKTTINGEDGIRVFASASQGSEVLDIKWSKSELNSELESANIDKSATESIYGSIEIDQQSVTYPYSATNNYIYQSVEVKNIGTFLSCTESNCGKEATSGQEVISAKRGVWAKCYCLIGEDKADVGKWASIEKSDIKTTFSITGLGSVTLSRDQQSASLGKSAFIKYTGSLSSWDRPTTPQYTPYLYNNNINLIETTVYSDIQNEYRDLIRSFSSSSSEVWDTSTYNSELRNLFEDKTDEYKSTGDASDFIDSIDKDKSGLTIYLKRPSQYPTFTIDLNAEDVGIVKLSGDPDVFNCESGFSFNSNELGGASFSVKNKGSGSGTFKASLENCDGISGSIIGGNSLGTFDSGETQSFKAMLQGQTEKTNGESVSCKIKIYDVNKPSNSDTCTVKGTLEYNPGGICSPTGKLRCSENMENLQICEDGDYIFEDNCKHGCTYGQDGEALCKTSEDGDGDGECAWYDVVCLAKSALSGFFSFFTILTWAIVGIFSIVSIFVSSDLLNEIESLKNIPIAKWVIAVLIGVALAFVLKAFIGSFWFWIVLIASIAYFMYGKPIVKALRITGR